MPLSWSDTTLTKQRVLYRSLRIQIVPCLLYFMFEFVVCFQCTAHSIPWKRERERVNRVAHMIVYRYEASNEHKALSATRSYSIRIKIGGCCKRLSALEEQGGQESIVIHIHVIACTIIIYSYIEFIGLASTCVRAVCAFGSQR